MKPQNITIVYRVVDFNAWMKAGNPLKFQHNGLEAHTSATYDAVRRCEDAEEIISSVLQHSVSPELEAHCENWIKNII